MSYEVFLALAIADPRAVVIVLLNVSRNVNVFAQDVVIAGLFWASHVGR